MKEKQTLVFLRLKRKNVEEGTEVADYIRYYYIHVKSPKYSFCFLMNVGLKKLTLFKAVKSEAYNGNHGGNDYERLADNTALCTAEDVVDYPARRAEKELHKAYYLAVAGMHGTGCGKHADKRKQRKKTSGGKLFVA